MALIKCRECGREISDRAAACPHCGLPLQPVSRPAPEVIIERRGGCMSAIGWVVVIVVGLLFFFHFVGANSNNSRPGTTTRAPTAAATSYAPTTARWTLVGEQGDMHFVSITGHDPGSNAVYHQAVTALCAERTHCFVHFWEDQHEAPRKLPMTEEQVNFEVAQYRMNRHRGLNSWSWRCGRFERMPTPGKCY